MRTMHSVTSRSDSDSPDISTINPVVQRAARFVDEVLQESGDAFEGDEDAFLRPSQHGSEATLSETDASSDAAGISSGPEDASEPEKEHTTSSKTRNNIMSEWL